MRRKYIPLGKKFVVYKDVKAKKTADGSWSVYGSEHDINEFGQALADIGVYRDIVNEWMDECIFERKI